MVVLARTCLLLLNDQHDVLIYVSRVVNGAAASLNARKRCSGSRVLWIREQDLKQQI